jgi:hypothetical protein
LGIKFKIAIALFCFSLALYVTRMAPSVVPGDPGEYQLIAARWGIGHPPGYGFYALLGNLFTRLVPLGTWAWRANLLSAVCGAAIVALAYGMGRTLSDPGEGASALVREAPPVLGALALACGLDLWQHAIHANAHIVTATLATVSVFCLVRWWHARRGGAKGGQGWLYLFCFVAGLSPVQHPLLVFAFPAYAAFIVVVEPDIWHDGRTLLRMVGCALGGLAAYLYYPIRCAIGAPPLPGPDDMDTWAGFVRVVTAQGLRGNLMAFSAGEIAQRVWDLRVPLRLQYTWGGLVLAGIGWAVLWARRWRPALLLSGYLACIGVVTVNILQDEMAYLLGPMAVVGVLIAAGAQEVMGVLERRTGRRWAPVVALALLAVLPLSSAAANWQRMDLSDFRDADEWLERVESRFVGRGEHASLLTEWERMTTVYYAAAVEGRSWDERDLRFVPISAGLESPFLQATEENLARGPVYLTMYRPQVAERYRLAPSGDLWQALPAWPVELPAGAQAVDVRVQEGAAAPCAFEIAGWRVSGSPEQTMQPGEVLLLDLYMRISGAERCQEVYLPWAMLGETSYHFTTDHRFLTPWWQPGEVVIERFELPVAWLAEPGTVSLRVGVQWVSQGRDLALAGGEMLASLAEITIAPAEWRPAARRLENALGNLGGGILLREARINGRRVSAATRSSLDEQPISLEPGKALRVVLEWESLRPIDENYKVFVQLLDMGLQIRAQGDDKAPLRGSAPTLLWFPRWRRGMRISDTYVLDVPADLPPGPYPLVVGMYGFSTFKRVQAVSPAGDMEGDWVTLAHLWVE